MLWLQRSGNNSWSSCVWSITRISLRADCFLDSVPRWLWRLRVMQLARWPMVLFRHNYYLLTINVTIYVNVRNSETRFGILCVRCEVLERVPFVDSLVFDRWPGSRSGRTIVFFAFHACQIILFPWLWKAFQVCLEFSQISKSLRARRILEV